VSELKQPSGGFEIDRLDEAVEREGSLISSTERYLEAKHIESLDSAEVSMI